MFNIIIIIIGYFLTKKDSGSSRKSETVGEGTGVSSKTWDKIILAGVAVIAYVAFKNSYDKYTKDQAFLNVAQNPFGLTAQQFKSAFEPYGSFLGVTPLTDTAALLALAPGIASTDWKGVQETYNSLYSEVLSDKLQKELSPADLVKFYAALGTGKTSSGVVVSTPGTTPAGASGSGKPLTPYVPSSGKYSLPGYRKIEGETVTVLRGKVIYQRDTSGKVSNTFPAGTVLGTALGWLKLADTGQIRVVYMYREHWYSLDEIRNVDANSVYLT